MLADIKKTFLAPPARYRPFVRWWWFARGLAKAEISRELADLHARGFGGVEIQTIYPAPPPSGDVPAGPATPPNHEIPWLGDEWLELVDHATREAAALGLQVDLTFGSGWPFGGPHVPPELASTRLTGYNAPLPSADSDEGSENGEPSLAEIPLEDLVENPDTLVSLLAVHVDDDEDRVVAVEALEEAISAGVVHWTPRPGRWSLFWFFLAPTGQRVKRAAPGAEGLVLDHLDRKALALHARVIDEALARGLGPEYGSRFGAFFCDSWEVYGENWTRDFFAKFRAATGYDLAPYLPVLPLELQLGTGGGPDGAPLELGEHDARVRYDYRKVHADLILHEFFAPFAAFCRARGVQCRVQPYSAPTDLLAAYGRLDVCEIEGFGPHGINSMYYGPVDPRLASSGAHAYGKPLVSCESFTWLGEHFAVPLEALKHEADQIVLHGVNRLVYHGYPYSPPSAGCPGWVFYAAIMANPNNPWWPHVAALNAHVSRNGYLSTLGRPVADFAVYLPIHDEWSDGKGAVKALRVALKQAGHVTDFDYLNDECLVTRATVRDGVLHVGHGRYRALVFHETTYLPVETAEAVAKMAAAGLPVVCTGQLPYDAPGLRAFRAGDPARVATLMQDLPVDEVASLAQLDAWLEARGTPPDFHATTPGGDPAPVRYLHRALSPDADFYFVVNDADAPVDARLVVRATGTVEFWDPLSGTTRVASPADVQEVTRTPPTSAIRVHLHAREARWIVLTRGPQSESASPNAGAGAGEDRPATPRPTLDAPSSENPRTVPVPGPWQVTFPWPANAFPQEAARTTRLTTPELFDWRARPEVQYFAGSATYETEFTLPVDILPADPERGEVWLDLGTVHEIADVTLNGTRVGVAWHSPRRLAVTRAVRPGRNVLRVTVTNLLLNKVIGYARAGLEWRPDYYFVNLHYGTFKPAEMNLLPSGLLGPVFLTFGS